MGTGIMIKQLRVTRKISLPATGVWLIILASLWISVILLSNIPQMVAASMANYIGLIMR
jgi:hypothetical protein